MKFYKALSFIFVLLSVNSASACTTLIIKDKQGAVYQGRTMEFVDFPFYVSYFPKLTKFISKAPHGKIGLEFIAKYSFIGITGKITNSKHIFVTDGVNSVGLTFSLNALNNSKLPEITQQKILDVSDLGSWILSQFSTSSEVRFALETQQLGVVFDTTFPFHIAVFDRFGKGIVIEYIDGKQIIYDNPVGVLTNGPDFNWHLTNLNNYASLSNVGNSRATINGYHIKSVDAGGNLLGLPSDDMSPSRFVRAAFYANYAEKPDKENAIAVLGKIMNKFDRIRGITADKDKEGGGEFDNFPEELFGNISKNKSITSELVLWTSLTDLNNNIYYIRPANSLNYYKFDLNTISKKKHSFSFLVGKLPAIL